MAINKGVDFDDIQTGNWNVAKPYTSEKILKWLVSIDDYETIATFGYSNIESDIFINNPNLQNTSRLQGLKRLIHSLISLIRNTRFALKKESHKKDFDEYRKRLKKIDSIRWKLRKETKRGNRIIQINIDEKLFEMIMDDISNIVDEINYRLNFSDLIFTHTEDYDPKKIKDALKERYINRG